MKSYDKPKMTVAYFRTENIVAASGTVTNKLFDGGKDGQPMTDSYGNMFGDK